MALRIVHPYAGEFPPSLSEVDALLVGGTPISANAVQDHEFLRAVSCYLADAVAAGVPVLGICCGAQMLAQVLGAEVRRCGQMEIGCDEVQLTAAGIHDDVLAGFPRRFPVFQWHGEVFGIPPEGQLLVAGEACRNQMFRAGSNWGVLFHLELTARDAALWADAYAHELARVAKRKAAVVRECERCESRMAELAERLLRNFLRIVTRSSGSGSESDL